MCTPLSHSLFVIVTLHIVPFRVLFHFIPSKKSTERMDHSSFSVRHLTYFGDLVFYYYEHRGYGHSFISHDVTHFHLSWANTYKRKMVDYPINGHLTSCSEAAVQICTLGSCHDLGCSRSFKHWHGVLLPLQLLSTCENYTFASDLKFSDEWWYWVCFQILFCIFYFANFLLGFFEHIGNFYWVLTIQFKYSVYVICQEYILQIVSLIL